MITLYTQRDILRFINIFENIKFPQLTNLSILHLGRFENTY